MSSQHDPKKIIGGLLFIVIMLLSGPGCKMRGAASIGAHGSPGITADGAEHEHQCMERPSLVKIDALTARRLALEFAANQLRLPSPIRVSARRAAPDGWYVYFLPGDFELPDGSTVRHPLMLKFGRIVVVTRDGRCAAMPDFPDEEPQSGGANEERMILRPGYREDDIIDEASAILLGRSYAVRKGLISTDMVVEERQLTNGEWLVSFVPGAYLPEVPGERPSPTLEPSVVLVDHQGKCRFFFECDQSPEHQQAGPPRPY
jgi:hypothetical protein